MPAPCPPETGDELEASPRTRPELLDPSRPADNCQGQADEPQNEPQLSGFTAQMTQFKLVS